MKPLPVMTDDEKGKFWALVDMKIPEACWEWKGSRLKNGYGRRFVQTTTFKAHRLAYYLTFGVDPGALQTCHTRDHPSCCNPAHLFLGTAKDNQYDCAQKGRALRGETNGQHKLTDAAIQAILISHDSNRVLSLKYGVWPTCIAKVRNQHSWQWVSHPRSWQPPSPGCGKRKLTQAQASQIRESSLGPCELARQLGISHTVIVKIRQNKIYKET